MSGDAALIEASLLRLAERGIEIRHRLFDRFFAAYPDRQKDFLCVHATSIRMTDETLQMMHGLASGESWVWPLVAELSYTHRAYGDLPLPEYDAFVDLTVSELADALGDDMRPEQVEAWRRQAEALKALFHRARQEWNTVLPR